MPLVSIANIENGQLWPRKMDQSIFPFLGFKEAYENVAKASHRRTKAGRLIFLNLILGDIVLRPEFNSGLQIFPEIEISVETEGP